MAIIFKKKKLKLVPLLLIILLFFVFIIVFSSSYLFLKFKPGDLVYEKDTGFIGEIKGISLPDDYLVQWPDGSLSKEPLFDLKKLSELSDIEIRDILEKESNQGYDFYIEGEEVLDYMSETVNTTKSKIISEFEEIGGFNLIIGEEGCEPNFICGNWGECQTTYNLQSFVIKEFAFGVQYRHCIDYSKCMADFVDSKKCDVKIPIISKKIELDGREFVEIYDENNVLISRLELVEGIYQKLNIQMLFDEKNYPPHCFDGVKNYDEDEIDCVYSGDSCPVCRAELSAEKGNHLLMIAILIGLSGACLFLIILYLSLHNGCQRIRKKN